MDEPFQKAERLIAEAASDFDLKRAIAGLYCDVFQGRPSVIAHMAKIMVSTLSRADDLDGQRRLAGILVHSIEAELKRPR